MVCCAVLESFWLSYVGFCLIYGNKVTRTVRNTVGGAVQARRRRKRRRRKRRRKQRRKRRRGNGEGEGGEREEGRGGGGGGLLI